MTTQKTKYIDSEHYRQMLVKDGDRRFQEWHTSFLHYQKQFLRDTQSTQSTPSAPYSAYPPTPASS